MSLSTKQWLWVFITCFLAVIASRVILFIYSLKIGHHIWPHAPGPCKVLKGIDAGSEDIVLLTSGRAIISTGLKFPMIPDPDTAAGIMSVDLNDPHRHGAQPVTIQFSDQEKHKNFMPHGLSSWTTKDGTVIIFVVSHNRQADTIERFKYDETTNTMHHLETIEDPSFYLVNDIAATGERSFYFTNSAYFRDAVVGALLMNLLMIPLGSFGYFNGEKAVIIESGMHLPNGILVSPDMKNVYVAVSYEQIIKGYAQDESDSLKLAHTVAVHTFVDNLQLDMKSEHLIVGGHPIPWRVFAHTMNTNENAPSQGLKFPFANPDPDRAGILSVDMNDPHKTGAIPLKIKWSDKKDHTDFMPHGISSWTTNDGTVILFVITHTLETEAVERFRYDEAENVLHHLDSIYDPSFTELNDLVATGERSFYFTNAAYFKTPLGSLVEYLLQLRLGSVGYYDGEKAIIMESGLIVPNGILLSPDRKILYVAILQDQAIRSYARDEATNSLKLAKTLVVNTFVDNMYIDAKSGNLLVGCHPSPWKVLSHISDTQTIHAPSQVLLIKTENWQLQDNITELYASHGEDASASSTAVIYKGKMLMGTVYHKALICDIVYPKL